MVICDNNKNKEFLYLKNFTIQSGIEKIDISNQNSDILVILSQSIDQDTFKNFIDNNKNKNLLCIIGEDLSDYKTESISENYPPNDKIIKVRTFGRFEVFINNSVLDFHSSKAKELFALCIDHAGGNVSIEEAVDKLWSERPFDEKVKKLYRKAIMIINKTFEGLGINNIFQTSRGYCRVNIEAINCDYYSFLKKNKDCIMSFNGEYMTEYDWAEETLAKLTRIAYGNLLN